MDIRHPDAFANERGSTLPMMIGVVLLVMVLLFATLATAEVAAERARQQSIADLAALAGANSLSKSTQTGRLIDFAVWTRNTTLAALYLAATAAAIASAGTGVGFFEVPVQFQEATIVPITRMESIKTAIDKTAIVHSVVNGAAVVRYNGEDDFGLAAPVSFLSSKGLSQEALDLVQRINIYEQRIKIARKKAQAASIDYLKKVDELKKSGLSEKEIKDDAEIAKLLHKTHEMNGSIGGLTRQRNIRQKELDSIKGNKSGYAAGDGGVVAVVYHISSPIPFTGLFGGVETGNNLAMAAATVEDGPKSAVIGAEGIKNLFGRIPGLEKGGDALVSMMSAVNVFGRDMENLEANFGPIGGFISGALGKVGAIPPPLTECRPALTSVDKVMTDGNSAYAAVKESLAGAEAIGKKYGIDILPSGLAP